jgi:hypothetical protein
LLDFILTWHLESRLELIHQLSSPYKFGFGHPRRLLLYLVLNNTIDLLLANDTADFLFLTSICNSINQLRFAKLGRSERGKGCTSVVVRLTTRPMEATPLCRSWAFVAVLIGAIVVVVVVVVAVAIVAAAIYVALLFAKFLHPLLLYCLIS